MSNSAVQNILKMIDSLPDDDRALLERKLIERAEAQWRLEVRAARRQARARGIDQAAIDEAVRRHRYGS